MNCQKCGSLMQDNAPVCPACGAINPLPAANAQPGDPGQQAAPGQPYAGQPYPGQQAAPGQPYFQQQAPGQPYPGQPYFQQQAPGQPYPGQPYYQQQAPGGQPYPGQPYYQQQAPGGQPYPGQPQYQQAPPPGAPFPGQPMYSYQPAAVSTITIKPESKKPLIILVSSLIAAAAVLAVILIVFVFGESNTDKLKSANSNAKLVFTTVSSVCADLVVDGKIMDINTGSVGPIRISDLKDSDPIQKAVKLAMQDNGTSDGYVVWNISRDYRPTFAQWSKENTQTIVGQYPDPETNPDALHYPGTAYGSSIKDDDYNYYF